MSRDFKIGMAMGLCLVAGISFWLAVQPSLSVKTGMANEQIIDTAPALPQNFATAFQPPKPPAVTAQPKLRIHVVKSGETLSAISKQYYGSSNQWQKILDANRSVLKNPDSLAPGMKLIIPD